MGLDIWFSRNKSESVAYFRKVNFLVKFFADKGMDVENQTPYRIREDDLTDLRDRCDKVLSNHDLAKELLPTTDGFFFGSTDYDDYYFEEVYDVLKTVDNLIGLQLDEGEYLTFDIWY